MGWTAGKRWCAALAAAALAAAPAWAEGKPQRIVSTNLCTDELLMRLVAPERIVSVTWLAWKEDATPAELQPLLPRFKPNHGLAEEVLMKRPDLVVTGTFSARFTTSLLRKLGVRVIALDPDESFDSYYANVRLVGEAVGEPERAEQLIASFKARLAALQAQIPPGERPVYADINVNFMMPGKDTLYTQVVNAGGFRTLGELVGFSGYRAVPLEQLIKYHPELISTGTLYDNQPSMATQNLHHPLLRKMAADAVATVDIPSRYTTCTTPETLDMVSELVALRRKVDAAKAERASK